MENEENRGLIHKKASQDQLVTFCQFSFRVLSLFSLSHTLGDLEFPWSTLGGYDMYSWRNKVKEEQESARGQWDQQLQRDLLASTNFHVCFPH